MPFEPTEMESRLQHALVVLVDMIHILCPRLENSGGVTSAKRLINEYRGMEQYKIFHEDNKTEQEYKAKRSIERLAVELEKSYTC